MNGTCAEDDGVAPKNADARMPLGSAKREPGASPWAVVLLTLSVLFALGSAWLLVSILGPWH